jgi:transposase-like protein
MSALGLPEPALKETKSAIAKALQKGLGIHKFARTVGVGAGTVQRVKATISLVIA